MTFIGHDLIDLQLAKKESDIFRRGYLQKVLTENEQSFLDKSRDIALSFWQMWSMKEAVYKILRQKGEERGFYPKKIEIITFDSNSGLVRYDQNFFYTETTFSCDYIETIALEDFNHFKNILRLKNNALLNKNQDIPFLTINNKRQPVSKSHHGKFESIITILN
jgi:phosphopantetheine--protein transferase-like protein